MQWSELPEYYILIILHTSKKNNDSIDLSSRKNNYIKIREIVNYIILKINKDGLYLANKYELNIIIYIIRDD